MVRLKDWRARYSNGRKGVCDFGLNYDFFFKWLLNKTISCVSIRGLPETCDETYTKTHLILDGNICYTDFDGKIYDCVGGWGGEPDEHYIPTTYIIANPILGSKTVYIRDFKGNQQNGVLIANNSIDSLGVTGCFSAGLYDLIHQTATLLADNIVSISCAQINGRVTAIFTADHQNQAEAGEAKLKQMYAGAPYLILKQDIAKKITVQPMAQSNTSQTLTQLVELHNYILASFFQSIGITANSVMKKERLITGEIDSQEDFVQLSLLEIIASWQRGFDEVNRLYGTDISVELNPVLVKKIAEEFSASFEPSSVDSESVSEPPIQDTDESTESDTDESEQTESISESVEEKSPQEVIEEAEEVVEAIVDIINDNVTEETEETEFTEVTEEEGEEDVKDD